MAATQETTEGTQEPAEQAGLPQMNPEWFASQLFWLAITFGLLFLVLWRKTLPMIAGIIGERRGRIEGDLATAEARRKDAAGALQAYESALAQARARALSIAGENRKRVTADIERMKAAADAEAGAAMSVAEKRIAADRERAAAGVNAAAAEAAAAIVERLIGTPVSVQEAATALSLAAREG